MTVSVRGVLMSPELIAQETAVTARCSTFGEIPAVDATVSAISAAAAAAGAGADTVVFAFSTRTAGLGFGAAAGDAYSPSVPAPMRHTSAAITTLTTRPFNLFNLVECMGVGHS